MVVEQALLECVIVEHNPTNQPINKAVIWLHGLGANGKDFEPIVPMFDLPKQLSVRFVFPQAPSIPVTINGGYVMPAWYDILERSLDRKVDVAQIQHSSMRINELIDEQVRQDVSCENIIIAGFSQGGAVAYHTVLSNKRKLAGLLAISTYIATSEQIDKVDVNKKTPVRIDHGEFDETVPMILGLRAKETLMKWGLSPTMNTYPVAHSIANRQIVEIGQWIADIFLKNE